jgi:hypothetical protein
LVLIILCDSGLYGQQYTGFVCVNLSFRRLDQHRFCVTVFLCTTDNYVSPSHDSGQSYLISDINISLHQLLKLTVGRMSETPAPESTLQRPTNVNVEPGPANLVTDATPERADKIINAKADTFEPVQVAAGGPVVQAVVKSVDDDEGSEPQNTLTKKFTEAEWSALKEFRVR